MTTLAAMVVGPIELAMPAWLWLLPPTWALVILIGRKSLSSVGSSSRRVALVARLLVVLLVVVTLAEPSWRRASDKLAVTAVIDMSRSVPTRLQSVAHDYIEAAAAAGRGEGDLLGGVTAARSAYVQSLPGPLRAGVETETIGSTDGTNLEEAVRMALAIRPSDAAYRLLVITDGNETDGSLLAAAETARAMGVPIDVMPLSYRYEGEVIVERVETPTTARMGDLINARVTIQATRATQGTLTILINGTPIDLNAAGPELGVPVTLDAGSNTLVVPLGVTRRGPQEIAAVFEPAEGERGIGDAIDENNRAGSITFFSGEGRVLVIAESERESADFIAALEAERIGVDSALAEQAPGSLIEFNAYDAVVLCNVPAYALSEAQQIALRLYVEDGGGGLLMTGGPDSFGAGGWIGSPLEDALPIQLDPPQTRQMPMGALAIVLDASGSMGQPVGGSGLTQQQIANRASTAAVDTLSRLDQIVVIAFSGMYDIIVPLTRVDDKAGISNRIERIGPGGGTNMFPAIEAAYEQLARSPAGVRHIIVLSDGQTEGDPRAALTNAAEMHARGTTISTVVIGDGANDQLMYQLAQRGGGRFYPVTGAQAVVDLPKIFVKEAQTVKRSLIWEGDPFEPALTGMPSAAMTGVTGVPSIRGYVVAADRQDGLAIVTLRGPEDDPILAQWQRGLGRVLAFTGDVTTRWSPDWPAWPGFRSFWGEHIRWVMRPSGSAEARTRIEQLGDESLVTVDLSMPDTGERINFATIRGRVSGPGGSSQDVTLRQEGPGRYVGRFESADPGSYIVGLRYVSPGTETLAPTEGSVQAAVTKPFTDEFRALEDNAALLRQIAERTGGRVLDADPARANLWLREGLTRPVARQSIYLLCALLAIGFFLIDVAVRRVRLDLGVLRAAVNKAFGPSAVQESASAGALREARAKAKTAGPRKPAEPRAPAAAARKFEYTPGMNDAPIAAPGAAPAPLVSRNEPPKEAAAPTEPADGLNRLLRAKKRAKDEMDQE